MILRKKFLLGFCTCSIFLIMLMFLTGCGGGNSDGGSGDNPAEVVTGLALLGPLSGAEVAVYQYDDLDNPIYSTTTSESTVISEAGLFDVPENSLQDSMLYVIAISGGQDIDADDDGVIDALPTDNIGTLHMAATGSQLKANTSKGSNLEL